MSTGQTGHKPGSVPPKFFMFIGFCLSPFSGKPDLTKTSSGKVRKTDCPNSAENRAEKYQIKSYEQRRRKFITNIHADLVFQACILFLRCFGTPGAPIREILVHTGMLPCLVPQWPQIMQIRISFRSRSDPVLDADHFLGFFTLSHFTGVFLVL